MPWPTKSACRRNERSSTFTAASHANPHNNTAAAQVSVTKTNVMWDVSPTFNTCNLLMAPYAEKLTRKG
jgi:hypothetical protein